MATLSSSLAAGPATTPVLFPPKDRQLLDECLQGHPAAWEVFVDRFAGLFAFVVDSTAAQWRIPLTDADREDLLAETLVEILQRDAAVLRSFRGNSTLATYLAVVTRRLVVRSLAKMADRRRVDHAAQVALVDDGPTHVDARDQSETMLARLAESDSTAAEMLRLHHLEGRSYGEISRIMGIPLGSIGPMLGRARQKMRELDASLTHRGGAGPMTTDGSARSIGSYPS